VATPTRRQLRAQPRRRKAKHRDRAVGA
jgi:hypothetical protein